MKIYRCAYCKELLGSEPVATCPHCKKAMKIPTAQSSEQSGPAKPRRRDGDEPRTRERTPHILPTVGLDVKNMAVGGMLLAMLVIGGLMIAKSGSVTTGGNAIREKRYEQTEREINVLRTALDMFKTDCGRYPTTEEGLMALLRNPGDSKWSGHYIKLLKSDPWRVRYVYSFTNDTIVLLSCGQDRVAGTSDDVVPTISQKEIEKHIYTRKYGPPTNAVATNAVADVSNATAEGSSPDDNQTVDVTVGVGKAPSQQ